MYKRRLIILLCFFATGLVVILARLSWMQLVCGDDYRREAELSLQSVELITEERGRILDRNGLILAVDEACFDYCLDFRLISKNERWRKARVREIARDEKVERDRAEKLFDKRFEYTMRLTRQLCDECGINAAERFDKIRKRVRRIARTVGRTVREERMAHVVVPGLNEKEAGSVRQFLDRSIGVTLRPGHRRKYPCGSSACHIIGVTGPVYREDADRRNLRADESPWLRRMLHNYLPGDKVGRTGVESMADDYLRPKRGYRRYSMPGQISDSRPAKKGRDVHLAMDITLQRDLEKIFAASGATGSAVLIHVDSGDVLAMVSWPTYNLNNYWEDYRKLLKDKVNLPLYPRAIAATYAPGSTVKPLTALAALGEGTIRLDTRFHCNGSNPHSTKGIPHCWIHKFNTGHGDLEVVGGLCHSCNIFFIESAHRLGAENLSKWFNFFGLGKPPGTGLPSEKAGGAGSEVWLMRHKNRKHVPSDAWFMSIGQGVVNASTLQLASAMAVIARGGRYISPRICHQPGPDQTVRILQLSDEHIAAVQKGMYEVINDPEGTAYKAWRGSPPLDVEVCGKTGTAQVPPLKVDIDGDGKKEEVKKGDHAWFSGFAPYRKPKVAFAVLVEYAGSGGKYAAPIAKEALRLCLEMGYLKTD